MYKKFELVSRVFLIYVLMVILWGAVVRATGSGNGCGDHWPLCNGQPLIYNPTTKTLIEFTHRITSGLTLFGAIWIYLWSRRLFAEGQTARKAAGWTLVLTFSEALIGALIVLMRWVAHDESFERLVSMALHLGNTFALIAAAVLTARYARFPERTFKISVIFQKPSFVICIVLLLLTGTTGTLASLGNLLFPVATLREGFAQDINSQSHIALQLRVFHPILALSAIGMSLSVLWKDVSVRKPELRFFASSFSFLAVLQVILGFLAVFLKAPLWTQLLHLLAADCVWLSFVLFVCSAIEMVPAHSVQVDSDVGVSS